MSNTYRVHEFAELIGKSKSTVRRWDRTGSLPARRLPGGERFYTDDDVRAALQIQAAPSLPQKTVVYCRVSAKAQADDLASQVIAMRQFCLGAGIPVDEWIAEIGGGMNFKRPRFLAIMQAIDAGTVGHLIVAHKDRLMRFGFELVEWMAEHHNCKITIANQEQLSPQQEMVEDLMAIVHTFSCRLYGLRSYKRQIQAAAEAKPE